MTCRCYPDFGFCICRGPAENLDAPAPEPDDDDAEIFYLADAEDDDFVPLRAEAW